MDAQALAAFEARASQAEQRLAALESKLGSSSNGSIGGVADTSRYVAELQSLRGVLVAAKAEQEALEKRVGELEGENSKLKYQVKHLKRAVEEGDQKLAAALLKQ